MNIYSRARLASDQATNERALLLEGQWPGGDTSRRASLDGYFDARWSWIDEQASDLSELAAGPSPQPGEPWQPSAAFVHALAMRYALVKFLRVAVWFDEDRRLSSSIRATLQRGLDEPYAALFDALAVRHGFRLVVDWIPTPSRASRAARPSWWRKLVRLVHGYSGSESRRWREAAARVVFSGQPRHLSPVADALDSRGAGVAWLYPELAIRQWLRWQARGVAQWTCEGVEPVSPVADVALADRLLWRGVNLSEAVVAWLVQRCGGGNPALRWAAAIERHFVQSGATHLVVDEDQTPFHRLAVALARARGMATYVVQHGAPLVRFGYAPLVADEMFVWGETSREQLIRWDVPHERLTIAGAPALDAVLHPQVARPWRSADVRRQAGPTFLFIATTSPRDSRPDSVALNLNARTWHALLRNVAQAAAEFPDAALVVRCHPRERRVAWLAALQAEFPQLAIRPSRGGELADELSNVDCVLSCPSSAAVEATLARVPVVQIVPPGGREPLAGDSWGFVATATTASEIAAATRRALANAAPHPKPAVLANLVEPAAERIADAVLGIRRIDETPRRAPRSLPINATRGAGDRWQAA